VSQNSVVSIRAAIMLPHGGSSSEVRRGADVDEPVHGQRPQRHLPGRQYSTNGERRSFALLRPITDALAQGRIRDLVLQAYAGYELGTTEAASWRSTGSKESGNATRTAFRFGYLGLAGECRMSIRVHPDVPSDSSGSSTPSRPDPDLEALLTVDDVAAR
jgi:hypothetical protein